MTARMSRPVWLAALTAAFIAVPTQAAPAPVTPGESPLALVPAQAPIVVHLKGVERAKDRLATFLKNALPDLGPVAAAQLDEGLKAALEGRKLQGLDPAGPIFVSLLEMPTGDGMPHATLIT